jgi:hypothetical protein
MPETHTKLKTILEAGCLLRGRVRQGLRGFDHMADGTLTFKEEKTFLDSTFMIEFKGPAREATALSAMLRCWEQANS